MTSSKDLSIAPLSHLKEVLKTFLRKELIPLLADLRLAIALLLTIAGFSISGTVLEQGQPLAFYQANYPEDPALFGFLTWKIINLLGLDHVYRTWWFLSLLILFGASLITCTFTRQIPALKATRRWQFYTQPRQFTKLVLSTELPGATLEQFETLLRAKQYRLFRPDSTHPDSPSSEAPPPPQTLYAHKGTVGRVGPIVVHASMLIILAGSILGTMTGFMAQEMVPSGDTFTIQHIIDAGPWAKAQIPQDWSVKVNRFWIDYTPDGMIDQFYSDLSVLDRNQQEVKRETIHVNQPLRYRGVTLYQADWAIAAVQVKLNNSPVLQFPMAQVSGQGSQRLWGAWVPLKPDWSEGISLLTSDLQGMLLVYDKKGELVSTVRRGMSTVVEGVTISVVDLIGSTGLQIKADPGIPLVYAGFGLLMLGVLMSYVSYSQVWVLQQGNSLYIGGKTNRAQVTFERELLQLMEKMPAP